VLCVDRAHQRKNVHGWGQPDTGGSPKSSVKARYLVAFVLADRVGRREYAVVYLARFSNQAGPLELGPWNKPNDFAHERLQKTKSDNSLDLDDEYHPK
jgi:hypothetical protein